jgi:hypothetical protein
MMSVSGVQSLSSGPPITGTTQDLLWRATLLLALMSVGTGPLLFSTIHNAQQFKLSQVSRVKWHFFLIVRQLVGYQNVSKLYREIHDFKDDCLMIIWNSYMFPVCSWRDSRLYLHTVCRIYLLCICFKQRNCWLHFLSTFYMFGKISLFSVTSFILKPPFYWLNKVNPINQKIASIRFVRSL